MLNLGLIGFTQPWLLALLVVLPALWWLLRVTPPSPRLIRFPAVRFFLGIEQEEETSAHTPPWLLFLRLLLTCLLILALAGPVWSPEAEINGDGPLVMVVDDGWAAAPGWQQRTQAMERLTERAVRQNREVILLGTAPDPKEPFFQRFGASDALPSIASWQPKPWPGRRGLALERLNGEGLDDAQIVWLSDGVAEDTAARREAGRFAAALKNFGTLTILAAPDVDRAILLSPPESDQSELVATARRPAAGPERTIGVSVFGPKGEVLARQPLIFDHGALDAEARIDLPRDLRNQIARLETSSGQGAGGTVLLDERWLRRSVGLVGLGAERTPQPLLSELYYVERALDQYADIFEGDIPTLLELELSAIVLTDSAQISEDDRIALADWIAEGGVLLRFAGPRLANAEFDDLVPVPLRRGDRFLDGTLSWARPLPLQGFDESSPLGGLRLPEEDVVISRQVLAQPGPALAVHSWARLEDGTPLITGQQRERGWLVLVHTTANSDWSTLPLSGAFVDLLQRVVGLGSGAGGMLEGLLAPIEILDGQGYLVEPGPDVLPVPGDQLAKTVASADHPPGLYGLVDAGEDSPRQALNLGSAVPDLQALDENDFGGPVNGYRPAEEFSLMPWLLLAAMVLALIDMLIALWLRGLLPDLPGIRPSLRSGAGSAMTILLLALLTAGGGEARAETEGDDQHIVKSANETHLAYVVTGLAEVDEVSRAGLDGLSLVLNRRTAVEAGDPLPVNLNVDDLNL
ncbi:MAG: BatA domain-containing protein [Geminicoccaceae bacterium]